VHDTLPITILLLTGRSFLGRR